LLDKLSPVGVRASDSPHAVVAAAEFLLEGLVAHRKISRSEERVFKAQEKTGRLQERPEVEREFDEWERGRRGSRGNRGGYN
jgi:magnesium chelatase subunit I